MEVSHGLQFPSRSRFVLPCPALVLIHNSYAIQWLVTLPLELIASSITLQYWGQPLGHHWVWVTIFLVSISIINISGVKGFANVEAGLSIMKVTAIVGFM